MARKALSSPVRRPSRTANGRVDFFRATGPTTLRRPNAGASGPVRNPQLRHTGRIGPRWLLPGAVRLAIASGPKGLTASPGEDPRQRLKRRVHPQCAACASRPGRLGWLSSTEPMETRGFSGFSFVTLAAAGARTAIPREKTGNSGTGRAWRCVSSLLCTPSLKPAPFISPSPPSPTGEGTVPSRN
jgi:hypothetical protein